MNTAVDTSKIRKRRMGPEDMLSGSRALHELDISQCATISYAVEDPLHPVEHLFDGQYGKGATFWAGESANATTQVVFEFAIPQVVLSRLDYQVEERDGERTQQIHMEVSTDAGEHFERILVPEYSFSPAGSTYQRESMNFKLRNVTHLKLITVPNKCGSRRATLTSVRLFR
jgi:hypothetical protein